MVNCNGEDGQLSPPQSLQCLINDGSPLNCKTNSLYRTANLVTLHHVGTLPYQISQRPLPSGSHIVRVFDQEGNFIGGVQFFLPRK